MICIDFDILFQEMKNIFLTGRVLTQTRFVVKGRKYLEIPNSHGSIDASSAKLATILLVHFINRYLTKKRQKQEIVGYVVELSPSPHNSVKAF